MSIIESVFHSLHSSPRFWFAIQSLVGIGAFSLFAHVMLKNRRFTLFYALFTSIHCLFTNSYFAANQFPILPIVGHFYLNASVFVHLFVLMKWRKLKPSWYLWSICLPGYFYLAWGAMGSMLSIPHSLLRIAFRPLFSHLDPNMTYFHLLTLSLTLYSFYLSFVSPTFGKEQVHIDLTHNRKKSEEELVDQSQNHDTPHDHVMELTSDKVIHQDESRILRVFQITDAHLGPYMSKKRLFKICQNIVHHKHHIDLVVITGDMETMDTHHDEDSLREALSPLKEISHKVVACLGNHDYEVLEKIRRAYQENSITLLEDDQTIIEIERWSKLSGEKSQIQIVGSSFSFAGMEPSTRHIQELCKKFPRIDANTPRVLLIHNPSILSSLDTMDSCDIVFSGHLHGGQIGIGRMTFVKGLYHTLKVFGKEKTLFKAYPPDQGLYGRRNLRLYSHRGTGHYGFPLRLGISSEQSLIHLYF